MRRLFTGSNPLLLAAVGYLLLTVFAAGLSFFWLPYDPNASVSREFWAGPSQQHLLGVDGSGRDVFSRLLSGSRVTVLVAVVTAGLSSLISLLLVYLTTRSWRVLAGVSSVFIDVLIAFPTLLVAIMLAAVFRTGIVTLLVALSFGFAFSLSRIVRGEVLQALSMDFTVAARAAGVSNWTIFWRHAVRYASPVLVTQTALVAGLAPLAESSLTYLGFGVNPRTPSLGAMLEQSQQALGSQPLHMLWPGLALLFFALSCFAVGDALRTWVDPRSRRRTRPPADVASALPATGQTAVPALTLTPAADTQPRAVAQPAAVSQPAAVTPATVTPAAAPLLEVSELTVATAQRQLLGPLSFSVAPGQKIGIIGASGSGKTLTALSIAQLLPAQLHAGGSVRFAGSELLQLSPAAAAQVRGAKISYVFQEPKTALDPLQKIWRQLTAPLAAHYEISRGQRLREARELTAMVGLEPQLLQRFPHQLSGGQRQRAALAAALAAEPQLLIADEITSSLDVTVAAKITELLQQLTASRELTLLYISHDLTQLSRVVDEILVLANGKLVERGSTSQILTRPQHPATQQLVAASQRGQHATA